MAWKIVTPPLIEPISLTLARSHLNIGETNTYFDYWLTHVGIPTAREHCEEWSSRAFAQQTVELALDAFSVSHCHEWNIGWRGGGNQAIELPMPPVRSVESVKYIFTDGNELTMAHDSYVLDNYQQPGWILPASGTTWPQTMFVINAVKIRTINGYNIEGDSPSTNPLPYRYQQAMLLVLGHYFINRENSSPEKLENIKLAAEDLMQQSRLGMGV